MRAAKLSVVALALFTSLSIVTPGRAEAQAVAFFPNVGSVPDGVGMSAVPVVTADRRYVRLSLDFYSSTINGFNSFPVAGAVSGGNGTGGLPGGGGGGGGLGGLGGAGGGAGGGFRNVFIGDGPADQGVPYSIEYLQASRKADAQLKLEQAKPIKGKKFQADPVMVPMKKTKPRS